MIAKDTIFRQYDIRGTVDLDFDAGFTRELGRAFASLIYRTDLDDNTKTENRAIGKRPIVAVGFDCRLSREKLSSALIEGLLEAGIDVINCGMGPTPQLYYMVYSEKLDGGIQVTGSHNPADQNGFKMMLGLHTLSGEDIQELKHLVRQGSSLVGSRGKLEEVDARSKYTNELVKRSKPYMGKRRLRVVVDAGNGVGGLVGPTVLRELGCEVIELYTEPDGRFPNHHPDPTVLDNIVELRARVIEEKADLGIGWDGDADRIGVVDEKGVPIFGDLLLTIYGRQLLKEVKNPTIIGDVKCSNLMFDDLAKRGAKTVMAKTGHSLIKAKLKELNAELAGEMSGHMFFSHRFFGFDDAIHASARIVEILSNTDQAMSNLLADLPVMVSTPEIRVDCSEEIKFQVAEQAKECFQEFEVNTTDGVRITFPHGWGLVRASNTQPVLVMRFEADTDQRLKEYQHLVEERIVSLRERLGQ